MQRDRGKTQKLDKVVRMIDGRVMNGVFTIQVDSASMVSYQELLVPPLNTFYLGAEPQDSTYNSFTGHLLQDVGFHKDEPVTSSFSIMDALTGNLPRHIQEHDAENTTLEPHWRYPSRVVPCTNDGGTCEYLKAVYWIHDVSMLYTFILWGIMLVIALIWVAIRGWRMGGPAQSMGSMFDVFCDRLLQLRRWLLLKDASIRWLFGRVSRLQVVTLACLLIYPLISS